MGQASRHLAPLCPGAGERPGVAFAGSWPPTPGSRGLSGGVDLQASTDSLVQNMGDLGTDCEMKWKFRLGPTRKTASPGLAGGDLGKGEQRFHSMCPGNASAAPWS